MNNLDQVLTNYDENKVRELQNTLESQLDQRNHHQQPQHSTHSFTSGTNSYYNTHSSSDNGIFTYNSSNASQARSNNYHSSPYLLPPQQQQHHQQQRSDPYSHRLDSHHAYHHQPSPQQHQQHLQQQQQQHHQKFNGSVGNGGGYLSGASAGVMHHQFSPHSQSHPHYIGSEQNNNTKTFNNHINTNTNPNSSNNNNNNTNNSGGDSVNRSIYHQNSNNNNNNFNNYNNNNNNNNQDINNKNPNTANKSHSNMPTNEPVKLVYPVSGTGTATNTTIVTGGQAGQTHHLPNGTISLSQMTGQPGSGGATIISSSAGLVKTAGHGPGIPQTLIIKNPQGIMTSSAPGMVTMTKTMNNQGQTNLVGTQMLQTGNFQIVNVPRANAPQTQNHQTQQKTIAAVPPRVVIGSTQLPVGARPANSTTLTLSALQSLQGGQPGQTILVKSDNGQYQLLRIAPPQGQQVAPGGTLTTTSGNQTIRLQTVPAQGQGPPGTIIVSSSGPVVTSSVLSNAVQAGQASQALQQQNNMAQQPPQLQSTVNATTAAPNRTSQDNSKEKCRKFLTNLIELSKREPSTVERNVRTLIQELIDANVEPEEFCERLERLLNASPQPCLIGFLKKSLPLLRQSLVTKEIVIEGIQPPTAQIAFGGGTAGTIPAQIRPVAQVGNMGQTQIRMITQPANTTSAISRIGQTTLRQTTPIRIQGSTTQQTHQLQTTTGPRLITNALRPGTATLVQNATAASGSVTIGSTTIQSTPPALHPVSGAAISQIRATTGTLQTRPPQTLQIRTSSTSSSTPVLKVQTTPKTVTTPVIRVPNSAPTTQVLVSSSSKSQGSTPSLITATTTTNNTSKTCLTTISPVTLNNKSITTKSQQQVSASSAPSSALSSLSTSTHHHLSNSQTSSHQKHTFPKEPKERKASTSAAAASYSSMYGDDDINDVAAMGGVNLAEESQRILGQTEFVGTQIRSCKDEVFLNLPALQQKIRAIVAKHGLDEPSNEVSVLISHATQERLKNIVEKLAVIAEHRIDIIKVNPRYEVTKDVRGQIKFLEDLDKAEQKRHEEQEREMLMRAAKSRSKTEDPEQVKLKQKAKEMQRAEMEELRQRDANLTALQAIGPRKKPRLDGDTSSSSSSGLSGTGSFSKSSTTTPLRPRIKRVNLRDMLFYLEHEKDSCRSTMLYKAYLK